MGGIVAQVLEDAGMQASLFEWRLGSPVAELRQCVQYDETEFLANGR